MFVFVIKEIREEEDVDLNDLAIESKINIDELKKLEENKLEDIELSKIYRIAKVLNVKIKDLYYVIEDYQELKGKLDELTLTKSPQDKEVQRLSRVLDALQNLMKK